MRAKYSKEVLRNMLTQEKRATIIKEMTTRVLNSFDREELDECPSFINGGSKDEHGLYPVDSFIHETSEFLWVQYAKRHVTRWVHPHLGNGVHHMGQAILVGGSR